MSNPKFLIGSSLSLQFIQIRTILFSWPQPFWKHHRWNCNQKMPCSNITLGNLNMVSLHCGRCCACWQKIQLQHDDLEYLIMTDASTPCLAQSMCLCQDLFSVMWQKASRRIGLPINVLVGNMGIEHHSPALSQSSFHTMHFASGTPWLSLWL